MNSLEIFKLADQLTEQQVKEILKGWELGNETEKIRLFNSLVRLGDSRELACATVHLKEPISKETEEFYRFAYEN